MKDTKKLFACFVGSALLLSLAQARPERNAFLNQAAPNLRSIIRQVKFDPQVLRRYELHFGMTKWELVAYFETLRLAELKETGTYQVFNAQESNGRIQSRMFRLRKGTRVYVDRLGQPILKYSCGNPMNRGPVKLMLRELVTRIPVAPPVDIKAETMDLPLEPVQPNEIMVVEELAVPTVTPTPPTPPVNPPKPDEPTIVKPTFEGPPMWLIPLLSGGLIIGLDDDGGGRPPVIPEPTTLLTTGALIGMLALRRKRKTQR